MTTSEMIFNYQPIYKQMNWLKKLFNLPIKLKIRSESIENVMPLFLDCPLCESFGEWEFPKDRHWNGYHFRLGMHWKPEKGHKDYELHKKLNYSTNK